MGITTYRAEDWESQHIELRIGNPNNLELRKGNYSIELKDWESQPLELMIWNPNLLLMLRVGNPNLELKD